MSLQKCSVIARDESSSPILKPSPSVAMKRPISPTDHKKRLGLAREVICIEDDERGTTNLRSIPSTSSADIQVLPPEDPLNLPQNDGIELIEIVRKKVPPKTIIEATSKKLHPDIRITPVTNIETKKVNKATSSVSIRIQVGLLRFK